VDPVLRGGPGHHRPRAHITGQDGRAAFGLGAGDLRVPLGDALEHGGDVRGGQPVQLDAAELGEQEVVEVAAVHPGG
jgi:hypothetical protein